MKHSHCSLKAVVARCGDSQPLRCWPGGVVLCLLPAASCSSSHLLTLLAWGSPTTTSGLTADPQKQQPCRSNSHSEVSFPVHLPLLPAFFRWLGMLASHIDFAVTSLIIQLSPAPSFFLSAPPTTAEDLLTVTNPLTHSFLSERSECFWSPAQLNIQAPS